MNSLQLLIPLAVAAAVGVVATAIHRKLAPVLAAPLLALTIVAVTIAVAPAMVVIALGYLTHLPRVGSTLAWCRDALGVHAAIPPWVGLPSIGLLGVAVVRTRSVLRSWRFFRRTSSHGEDVIPSDALFAYTLPGPGRHVVMSSALVEALEPDELAVVLAHERSHARHRHDRYVLIADVAEALVPVVRPLHRRLMFTLERWADEAAVEHTHGDRGMVARTLARVALSAGPVPVSTLGVASLGVGGRVEALLDQPELHHRVLWVAVMACGAAVVGLAGVVQVHHLAPLLVALCPG